MAGLMRDAAPGLACWMGGCSCSPSSRRRPRRAWRSAGASIPGRRLRTTMSVTLFITVVVTPAGHDIDFRDISHFSGRNCNRISAICPLCLGSKRGTPPPPSASPPPWSPAASPSLIREWLLVFLVSPSLSFYFSRGPL